MFKMIAILVLVIERILNSLVDAGTQGPERVKAPLFKEAHPPSSAGPEGSARGEQTLIKPCIAHAFTSSLLIHWNKFQCVRFN